MLVVIQERSEKLQSFIQGKAFDLKTVARLIYGQTFVRGYNGLDWSIESLLILMQVIAIDIVLSGDNAVVIAMATRRLPKEKRNQAIYWGTFFAIALRIMFAIFIVFLLKIPLVHFLGGLLLVYIAYKVLIQDEGQAKNVSVKDSMAGAIWTIISADIVMSMDNVVAVAGASAGNYLILALGVLISIPIMIFGSKIILSYMERYPWIAYIGSGILAWTAGGMIIGDELIRTWFNLHEMNINIPFTIIVTALVLLVGYWQNKRIEQNSIIVKK